MGNYKNRLNPIIGINKPIIALVNESNWKKLPTDLNAVYVLRYNENNYRNLCYEFEWKIPRLVEQVIDKATFCNTMRNKIIGISVGEELDNFELD
ncbi:hypothetical protein FACS189451_04760 [Bacteroidia bacterium]|nr:hypothetical protein FACS189451_04760 [Bacteroidia bacterium]